MAAYSNDSPVLACSLTDAEVSERRAAARARLLPHVLDCRLNGLELLMEFPDVGALRSELETFVDIERQCCGFLDFAISSSGEKLTIRVAGPEGSQSTLQLFADAVGGV